MSAYFFSLTAILVTAAVSWSDPLIELAEVISDEENT